MRQMHAARTKLAFGCLRSPLYHYKSGILAPRPSLQAWDGEAMQLYRVLITIMIAVVAPVFLVLTSISAVLGISISPVLIAACGMPR